MDKNDVDSIVSNHGKKQAEVKAGIKFDEQAVKRFDKELKAVKTTVKELREEMEKLAIASQSVNTGGGAAKAQNGQPQFSNSSQASSPGGSVGGGALAQLRARFGGAGGGGGLASRFAGSSGAAMGVAGVIGFGGAQIVGAIDKRIDSNRAYSIGADRLGVDYRQRTGMSQNQYESYRNMIVGRPGQGAIDVNEMIGYEARTGVSAAMQRGGVGQIRAMSGYSMSTSDVLGVYQQNLNPAVANRQFMMQGGLSAYGPGGQPRDQAALMRARVGMFQLDDPNINRGALRQGSISRHRMSMSGITGAEQDLLINMGQNQSTFAAKGGKGTYDPTNKNHQSLMGTKDSFATAADESERLRTQREESMYSKQEDNYAKLEKSNQALIKAMTSLEGTLGGVIGARASSRGWQKIGGRLLQGAGLATMIVSGGTAAAVGAGMFAVGTAAASGDPTEGGGGGGGASPNISSSGGNDDDIHIPVGYGGAKKSLTEVKQRSDFQKMHPKMQQRMLAMFRANPNLGIGGGFRDSSVQEKMFLSRYSPTTEDTGVKWKGKYWKRHSGAPAAPPGRSMHEIGLAADLVGDLGWLQQNAARFGLKTFADVNNEPWHVQATELPNSRAKYEAAGASWGTNGAFDEDAVFTEEPGSSEHNGRGGGYGVGAAGTFTGLTISQIIGEYMNGAGAGSRVGGGGMHGGGKGGGGGGGGSVSPYTGAGALTGEQVAVMAHQAGFRGQDLINVVAIAKRESGYDPNAHNGNRGTGDNSYGLMQINMLGDMGPSRMKQFGISKYEDLFNPQVNLNSAFSMYSSGGNSLSPWGAYKGESNTYSTDIGAASQAVANSGVSGDPVESGGASRGGGPVNVNNQYSITVSPNIVFQGQETPQLRSMAMQVSSMLKEQVDIAAKRSI